MPFHSERQWHPIWTKGEVDCLMPWRVRAYKDLAKTPLLPEKTVVTTNSQEFRLPSYSNWNAQTLITLNVEHGSHLISCLHSKMFT